MQSSKIEFLSKYNDLIATAFKASTDFPDTLCEFLVNELEFQSAVLFKVEDNILNVLGKSASAKKIFAKNTTASCNVCKCLNNQPANVTFNSQPDCEIQSSEFVIYEGCLHIKTSASEKILIKAAKKTPFSQTDRSDIEFLGEAVKNLYNIWTGNKGNVNSSLSEIVSGIAHELRTPTNSIMGFASLLNEDNLTQSQTEYVSTLKDSAYNLLSLINDLIDLAKVDTGVIKEVITAVEIKNLIDDVLKLFSDKIDKNRIEFIVTIEDNVPASLKLDSQKLRYILLNIITNSLRLTEKGKIKRL